MKANRLYSIAAILLVGFSLLGVRLARHSTAALPVAAAQAVADGVVGAPGRVEPVSEEIKVAAELKGKLRWVGVEEGDKVQAGQVIAELENDDYRARAALAQAEVEQRQAELRRVINGARAQERREAWAEVQAAEAVLANSRIEFERRKSGYREGVFAKEEADRAEREHGVAQGRYEAALERYRLVDAEAREEDRSRAEAELAAARARLAEAQALYQKTLVRAPIRGLILRKHLKVGESVSEQRDTPIVTLADVSRLRVRVDVDETDVAKIRLGQRAYVHADAYGGRKFWGRVVRVGRILGRKNIRTDEPTERVDTKVLETLIELEAGTELPIGMRVDAFILLKS